MISHTPLLGTVLSVFLPSLICSLILVFLVYKHAVRRGLLDHPNARSSHAVATPRGGGLGLIATFLLVVSVADKWSTGAAGASAAVAVVIVAIIGWVDDHGSAAVGTRIAVHLVAAMLLIPMSWQLAIFGLPLWVSTCCWVFWTVSAINVVNFMDGIDGIIAVSAVVFGGHVARLAASEGLALNSGLALAGASLGFLYWNWSPAKIFMGDVGSGALGVVLVGTGALLMRQTGVDFVVVFAPIAPLFFDATVTIVARKRRGERLTEAHRSHLYQRLANSGLGHARVAAAFGVCSLGCAALTLTLPMGGGGLLMAILSLCGAAYVFGSYLLSVRREGIR